MAVMAFDTDRLGRRITGDELSRYSQRLAVGVTEAMHHSIGHDRPAPRRCRDRYQAVMGAHITHTLRDMIDDVRMGYYNIPSAHPAANNLAAHVFDSLPYRSWVRERVQLARDCFAAGSRYAAAVPCRRCRFAGFAYMSRCSCARRHERRLHSARSSMWIIPRSVRSCARRSRLADGRVFAMLAAQA